MYFYYYYYYYYIIISICGSTGSFVSSVKSCEVAGGLPRYLYCTVPNLPYPTLPSQEVKSPHYYSVLSVSYTLVAAAAVVVTISYSSVAQFALTPILIQGK
jgi:hypothetical protein